MRGTWPALTALLLLPLSACSADEAEPTSAAPLSTASPESRIAVTDPRPASEVTVTSAEVASSAEVRVGEILSELDTTARPEGTVITLPETVLFDFDQAVLKPSAQQTLADIAEVIAFYAQAPVAVHGHTDSVGDDDYNQDLSERRAAAVVAALVDQHRVDRARLRAEGFGETRPLAANTRADGSDDAAARQRNRRVEIVLQGVVR